MIIHLIEALRLYVRDSKEFSSLYIRVGCVILNAKSVNFPDSDVVYGLEIFFSLESIGVSPESSSYDERYLKEFDDSVEFRDERYYVSLPWHSDIIDIVSSNFGLAKVIAKKGIF